MPHGVAPRAARTYLPLSEGGGSRETPPSHWMQVALGFYLVLLMQVDVTADAQFLIGDVDGKRLGYQLLNDLISLRVALQASCLHP